MTTVTAKGAIMNKRSPLPAIALGAFFLLIFGVVGWNFISEQIAASRERAEKLARAKEMVEECRSCDEERLPDMLHRADPWGNDLIVKYHDGFLKSLTICSLGPDGTIGTKDDITANRHVKLDWKKAGEGLGEVGGDLGQGIWRGLKRSFANEEEKDKK
jgi:hypothetical protein